MKKVALILVVFLTYFGNFAAADGFTQADRERMIRTEITLQEYIKSNDKRMEELITNMNHRFDAVDKRFEAADKRFEDMNNRFANMIQYLFIVITLFGATAGGVFLYVLCWDRKTFMATAFKNAKEMVDVKISNLQKEGKLHELIKAIRELAKDDPKVRSVLFKFNLLSS